MPNNTLTYGEISNRAVKVLENYMPMTSRVFRGYQEDFRRELNGYLPGETITIRRPTEFFVADGAAIVIQDATEGTTTLTVNKHKHVGINFTARDMTLDITDFSARFIEPIMIQMAQQVEADCSALFADIPNWVGTPGVTLSNFASFGRGVQRLDDTAVPIGPARTGIVTPADALGLQANLTGPTSIFVPELVKDVYKEGMIVPVDGVTIYKSQNAPMFLTGTRTNGTLDGGTLSTTFLATKDTNVQSFSMAGLGANGTVKKGDVFTLAGVFDVNPRSKASLPYLKQFVSTTDVTADATGDAIIIGNPPVIISGAFQNASAAPASNAAVTWVGAANTTFANNLIYNELAFALVMVPFQPPVDGAGVRFSRKTYKGINLSVTEGFDINNYNNIMRFDILYGLKTTDPRMAVRLSG